MLRLTRFYKKIPNLVRIGIILSIIIIIIVLYYNKYISKPLNKVPSNLISGFEFRNKCKYNLDDRYPLVPYDSNIEEGDSVFLKVSDIPAFLNIPPLKKVILVIHNSDETFNDNMMRSLKPYIKDVYAVNCSAVGAIQIPLGIGDSQYRSHTVLTDTLNDISKSANKDILCLVNFLIHTNGGERTIARDSFKGKKWVIFSEKYLNYDFGKSLENSDKDVKRLRLEYYAQLKRTKFVICPAGSGVDTHRVYESLYFGAIPIIKTSFLDPMYKKVGECWIVKDWSEVTEEECNRRWSLGNFKKFRMDVNDWFTPNNIGRGAPTFSFISYANERFKKAGDRIKKEAEEMGCFNGMIKVYSPDDFSKEFKDNLSDILKQPRGGGYWIWKSYIINDMLSKLNENDIVLYTDAGCTLKKEGLARLMEYVKMISPESGYSVLAMRLRKNTIYGNDYYIEKNWTSSAIFDEFKVPINGEIANSSQILGGVQMYRNCKESRDFLSKWLKIAETRSDLFTDKYNEESKKRSSSFTDNRHDQSIFSILIKLESSKNYCRVIDEEIEGDIPDYGLRPIIATRKN